MKYMQSYDLTKGVNKWTLIYIAPTTTLRDPILIKQDSFWDGEGGSESEHEEDNGQSPQEHPSEVSEHE